MLICNLYIDGSRSRLELSCDAIECLDDSIIGALDEWTVVLFPLISTTSVDYAIGFLTLMILI
jgi:hypothetical protein